MLMSGVSTCFYPRGCRGAFLSSFKMQSPSAVQLAELGYQADLETCWHLRMESGSLAKGPVVIFNIFFVSPWAPCPMFLTTPHSFLTPKCQRSVRSLRLVSISFSEPCSSLRRTVLWARSLHTLLRLHLCCLRWVRSWRPKACLSYRNVTRERLLFQNEKMKLGTVLDSVVRML